MVPGLIRIGSVHFSQPGEIGNCDRRRMISSSWTVAVCVTNPVAK